MSNGVSQYLRISIELCVKSMPVDIVSSHAWQTDGKLTFDEKQSTQKGIDNWITESRKAAKILIFGITSMNYIQLYKFRKKRLDIWDTYPV